MKRVMVFVFAIVMLCTACSKKENIELPCSPSDIRDLEMYRYHVPASAQKKVITSEEEIEEIVSMLTSIEVKNNDLEPVSGSEVTSFRINMTDGTDLEIIYVNYGEKQGEIKSSHLFDYQTSADVGGIWEKFAKDSETVDEKELPVYEQ